MNTQDEKLTLKLKRNAIAKAKRFAKAKGTSLSRLVEGYFFAIAEPVRPLVDEELSPLIKSLVGAIREERHTDFRKEYREHLQRKYKL